MLKYLTFITGNVNKAQQLSQYLKIPLEHHQLDLVEIQSLDFKEVIEHKVKEAYQHLKKPVIVDDVSVIIHAMGNLPGPLIKWFKQSMGDEGICKLANFYTDKKATASVGIGFYDGETLKTFVSSVEGSIAKQPAKLNRGFGWDVFFIPKGFSKPRSTLSQKDYDLTSPRKKALEKLAKFLKSR